MYLPSSRQRRFPDQFTFGDPISGILLRETLGAQRRGVVHALAYDDRPRALKRTIALLTASFEFCKTLSGQVTIDHLPEHRQLAVTKVIRAKSHKDFDSRVVGKRAPMEDTGATST